MIESYRLNCGLFIIMEVARVPQPILVDQGDTIHTVSYVFSNEVPNIKLKGLGVKVELNCNSPYRLVCYIISADVSGLSEVDVLACPLDLSSPGVNLGPFAHAIRKDFGERYFEAAYRQAEIAIQRELGLSADYTVSVYPDRTERIRGVKGIVFFHNRIYDDTRSLLVQRVQGVLNAATQLQGLVKEDLLSIAIPLEKFSPEGYFDNHLLLQFLLGLSNFSIAQPASPIRNLYLIRRSPLQIDEAVMLRDMLLEVLDDIPDMASLQDCLGKLEIL